MGAGPGDAGGETSAHMIDESIFSQLHFRALMDVASEGIHILDETGLLVDANQVFLEELRRGREAVGSLYLWEWNHTALPERLLENVTRIVTTGESTRFETVHVRADGTEFEVEVTTNMVRIGSRRLIYAASRDISARKANERALNEALREQQAFAGSLRDALSFSQTVLLESPVGLGIYKATGDCVLANDAYAALVGASRVQLESQNFFKIQSWQRTGMLDACLRTLAEQHEVYYEIHTQTSFGREAWARCHVLPIQLSGEAHLLIQFVDLSQIKRAEAELERYRLQLEDLVKERTEQLAAAMRAAEQASIAKSAFLANMSHEIRTPLNAILGMSALVRRDGATPGQANRLDKLDAAGRHLLGLINQILDLSKVEAERLEFDTAVFEPCRLLADVVDMVAGVAAEKGLVLLSQCDSGLRLCGDVMRLTQAMANLANNAVKFTETGTVTLRVLVTPDEPGMVIFRFEVEDEGIGIAPHVLDKLFNPFVQADSSISRDYGGTGLGLALTRRLAEAMGGEAGATSTVGRGSTFWITARLKEAAVEQCVAEAPGVREVAVPRVPVQGPFRILLVEDEPFNREIAIEFLADAAAEVDVAENGEIAVEKATVTRYDLILMDMQMPVMDGLEATRRIRTLPHGAAVPIVALTANAYSEDRLRCIDAGMDDFLPKPMSAAILLSLLDKWLGQSSRNV